MRLFHKHLLVAVVPLLLAGLGASAISTFLCIQQILESAKRSARTEVRLRAEHIRDYFTMRLAEAETIAAAPMVRTGRVPEMMAYFRREQQRLASVVEGLYFNDLQGNVFTPDQEPFNVRDRYYFQAMQRGETVVTRVLDSRATGNLIVLLIVPVWGEDNQRVGSLGAAIPVRKVLNEVQGIKPGENGFAALIDDQGQVLAAGVEDAEHALLQHLNFFQKHLSGQIEMTLQDEQYLATFTEIQPIKWTLVLAHSRTETLSTITTIQRGCLALVLAAFVLAVCVASYSHRRLLAPMTELVQVQQSFGEGNIHIRATDLPDDEVGDLGRSFNRMADLVVRRETESAQAHESLRQQEALVHGIIDNMTAAIYVKNTEGRYVLCNHTVCSLFGLTMDQILGKTDQELMPAEAPRLREADLRALQATKPIEYDESFTFQGEERTFITVKFPLHRSDGSVYALCGISTDITLRQRTEQALRESEARFSRAVRGSNDGIWDWNIQTDELYCSTRLWELLGHDEPILDGKMKSFEQLMHPEDIQGVRQAVKAHLWQRVPYDYEHRLLTRSGEYRWFRARGSAVWSETGEPLQMAGSLSDIHEQKKLEADLRQSQKMEAIGQLAGGVAHDFNNLLTVINGYCELLLEDADLPETALEFLREMSHAGHRASDLTQQLLAFSRKQLLVPEVLDVNEVVHRSKKLLERVIGEHIQLNVSCTDGLGSIRVDPSQLGQVILNLAVNARDAMTKGGSLLIRTYGLHLESDALAPVAEMRPGDYVVLEVTDTGTGISEDDLPRIFEPFFTTKEVGQGTGLGLATIYGIVRQLEGHIEVSSKRGEGATFKIYLPSRGQCETRTIVSDQDVTVIPGGNERLLLVEDERLVREFAERILRSQGYEVVTAENGEDALRLIDGRIEFDLLVTDVVMPGISGTELASRLREQHPELRVVFTTGYPGNLHFLEEIESDHSHWLQKPYSARELAQAVRSLLDDPQ